MFHSFTVTLVPGPGEGGGRAGEQWLGMGSDRTKQSGEGPKLSLWPFYFPLSHLCPLPAWQNVCLRGDSLRMDLSLFFDGKLRQRDAR
jgi:hypothetical protein